MKTRNAMFIENGYATIARPGGDTITTTMLRYDRYVRIDDGRQLCIGAARFGDTLIYWSDERLARDCNARLYKTRKGFDAAAARLWDDADPYGIHEERRRHP